MSDPGGYESLTWGSVQRPLTPSLSTISSPTFSSSRADTWNGFGDATTRSSPGPGGSTPISPAGVPPRFYAVGPPLAYPSPYPTSYNHSAPGSPEVLYHPSYATPGGYYSCLSPPFLYSPTNGPHVYATSADGSTEDGGPRPSGRTSRGGGRGGKRGGRRKQGAGAGETMRMGPVDDGTSWRASGINRTGTSETARPPASDYRARQPKPGSMGARPQSNGISLSGSYPRLPSASKSSGPSTPKPADALSPPAPSYRSAAMRSASLSPSTPGRLQTAVRPVPGVGPPPARVEVEMAKLTVRDGSEATPPDRSRKLSWAGVVKGS